MTCGQQFHEGPMKDVFNVIWKMALPYQDKRDDIGHAEIALKYARELAALENGNEDVIIPAIILHDIGWSQLIKERRMLIFDKDASKEDRRNVQLEHQIESVKLAGDILRNVNYPEELTKEILEIISQHDTREGFISKNEGLVRDADKLWRTSKEGFAAAEARRKVNNKPRDESMWKKIEEDIHKPGYFYFEKARQIAIANFKLRLQEKP
jgi:HD superfamily phosphodiesterase